MAPADTSTRPICSVLPRSTDHHGYISSSEMKQLPSSLSGTKSGSVISSGSPPPPLELESPSLFSARSSSVKQEFTQWQHIQWACTANNNVLWPHGMPINSSPLSAAYMCKWIGSALVHIMACRLFGAKQLSTPMLGYCHFDPQEQTSVKCLSKYKTIH